DFFRSLIQAHFSVGHNPVEPQYDMPHPHSTYTPITEIRQIRPIPVRFRYEPITARGANGADRLDATRRGGRRIKQRSANDIGGKSTFFIARMKNLTKVVKSA
ncbi:hypothetical protein KIH75_09850, partial [Bifidobacterium sp. 64T4]|uniref:hypothetical protein n=1 Tax=Bifidobacterium pongonis TaxID=2834432 RepID=UPI001C56161E